MRRKGRLILAACLAAATGSALTGGCQSTTPAVPRGPAQPDVYNLRGTAIRGAIVRKETEISLPNASLKIEADGLALAGVTNWYMVTVDDLEILEVVDSMVRKGRLSHVVDRFDTKAHMAMPDGTAEDRDESEDGALHGRSEIIEYVAGGWRRTLEGAAPTAAQAREMRDPPLDAEQLPAAIRVGESWTQTGPELRRWLGGAFTTVSGEVKSTLLAVEVVGGERIARYESIGEVHGTMIGEDNEPTELGMGLHAIMRRSLDRAIDIDGTAEGAMTVKGATVSNATSVTFSISGRYTARFAESTR